MLKPKKRRRKIIIRASFGAKKNRIFSRMAAKHRNNYNMVAGERSNKKSIPRHWHNFHFPDAGQRKTKVHTNRSNKKLFKRSFNCRQSKTIIKANECESKNGRKSTNFLSPKIPKRYIEKYKTRSQLHSSSQCDIYGWVGYTRGGCCKMCSFSYFDGANKSKTKKKQKNRFFSFSLFVIQVLHTSSWCGVVFPLALPHAYSRDEVKYDLYRYSFAFFLYFNLKLHSQSVVKQKKTE